MPSNSLDYIRAQSCMIDGCLTWPCDVAHVRSRGSGGGDEPENVMPLCHRHHMEQHTIGIKSFAEKYDLPITFEYGYPRRSDLI